MEGTKAHRHEGTQGADLRSAEAERSDLPLRASVPPCLRASSGGWLSLGEAARRSGGSVGHIRRRCATEWVSRGLARLASGKGTKATYEVREDADAAFSRVKFPEQIGGDLRKYSQAQRDEAVRRKGILDGWDKSREVSARLGFTQKQLTAQFLSHLQATTGERISPRTLHYWYRAWRSGGIEGLIDGRSKVAVQKLASEFDPFLAEVQRLFLSSKLRPATCHEVAMVTAREKGWTICSLKTSQRHLNNLSKPIVARYRGGESKFVDVAEPYIERDYSGLESNELWVSDHHQWDVIVSYQGKHLRPWVTVWQDMRSRKFVGWTIYPHDPNTDTILTALRFGCDYGVPRGILADNGRDYRSFALTGVRRKERWVRKQFKVATDEKQKGIFAALDIEVKNCLPYHGQTKPCERWFRTMEMFTPSWRTYCGNNTENKPEDLYERIEKGQAPAFDEFAAWAHDLIASLNTRVTEAVDCQGKTPDQVFAENLHSKRTASKELLETLLMARTEVVVGQNGVTYKGLRYGQYERELFQLMGQKVAIAVDERDISSVQVFSLEGRFICIAPANQRLPVNASAQELREAIAKKKNARKTMLALPEARMRMADDLPDLILRSRAAAVPAKPIGVQDAPPILRPLRSDLEDQLPALRRALEVAPTRRAELDEEFGLADLAGAFAVGALGEFGDEESGDDTFAALKQLGQSQE